MLFKRFCLDMCLVRVASTILLLEPNQYREVLLHYLVDSWRWTSCFHTLCGILVWQDSFYLWWLDGKLCAYLRLIAAETCYRGYQSEFQLRYMCVSLALVLRFVCSTNIHPDVGKHMCQCSFPQQKGIPKRLWRPGRDRPWRHLWSSAIKFNLIYSIILLSLSN